ncbi:PAAR domain-containing protein [Paraburkholderia caffeinilytica]|uniref:PAAR domain-containing protein n=1 Tax=Paraburkholderia caffeinilytica TaxID=1761016 RepID=UPI003DA15D2E
MQGVIRVGDKTSHGGVVVTGSELSKVMDRGVARVGDRCTCPIPGHEECVIVEGHPYLHTEGRAVALNGHRTSCGATLISTILTSCIK